MRALALMLLATGFAAAQAFSVGVEAGVHVNPLLTGALPEYQVKTRPYTVGPNVNVRLPRRFSVEVDLLYKPLEYAYSAAQPVGISRWELPLMLGYNFTDRRWQPFVHLGGSLNRVVHIDGVNVAELRHRATQGIAAGAGVERRVGPLRFVPEVRITHWRDHYFGVHDAPLRLEPDSGRVPRQCFARLGPVSGQADADTPRYEILYAAPPIDLLPFGPPATSR